MIDLVDTRLNEMEVLRMTVIVECLKFKFPLSEQDVSCTSIF